MTTSSYTTNLGAATQAFKTAILDYMREPDPARGPERWETVAATAATYLEARKAFRDWIGGLPPPGTPSKRTPPKRGGAKL